MIAQLFVAAAVVYVIAFYLHVRKYPKGPLPLPIIENLYHLRPHNLHRYMHEVGQKYGNCYTLFLPKPTVIMTDYAHVKEALVTQGEHFAGRSHAPPETLLQEKIQTGVLIADGDVWRTQRRTSLKIFREFGMGRGLMEEQVNRSIAEMMAQLKVMVDTKPIDMNLPLQLCVGNIINETLFGFHYPYTETEKFEGFIKILNKHLQMVKDNFAVFLVQSWPWLKNVPIIGYYGHDRVQHNVKKYQDFIRDQVNDIAAKYEEHDDPSNFIQAYLQEMRKGTDGLDLDNLIAVAVDFWLAGMETTSTTLRWSLLFLMKYPEVKKKMMAELDGVIGRTRMPTMADKANMPYFSAAITEIQRCANMIPFLGFHRCTRTSNIHGKIIPEDTLVMPQIFSVLENDEAFEDAAEFRPERFLESDGKTINKKTMERMIAFGLGKRQCVGEGLAKMELFLVLAALLQHFDFNPNGPLDFDPLFSAVLVPKPYTCYVNPRD